MLPELATVAERFLAPRLLTSKGRFPGMYVRVLTEVLFGGECLLTVRADEQLLREVKSTDVLLQVPTS